MAIIHVDESTPGLPNSGRLSGTNGDLVGILDVALVLNGWAIEYSTGNARIYRPGSGNRFRLYVNDDSSVSGDARCAVVRGCENASAASNAGLVDPFPLSSQVADASCNWLKSSLANTTARIFDIWVGETWIVFAVNYGGATNIWEVHAFGDFAPAFSGDSYNTLCTTRNSTNFNTTTWSGSPGWMPSAVGGSTRFVYARSYDGTVKSVLGGWLPLFAQTAPGVIQSSLPGASSGPTTGIDTDYAPLYDSGSNTGTVSGSIALPIRGWMNNVLSPMHGGRGARDARYSYTDSPYMTTGKVVTAGNTATSGFIVVQESDDFVPPVPV